MAEDEITITVSKKDLEFVLDWAEGGMAEYSHRNLDETPVLRVREALKDALILGS